MRLTHDLNPEERHSDTDSWTQQFRVSLILLVMIYILATSFTRAAFLGDTRAYTSSILDFTRGETYPFWADNGFWDFGHLLWRPAGWLAFRILHPITSLLVGSDARDNIVITLEGLNWVAGLVCVVVLNLILRAIGVRAAMANLTTLAFLFARAFLNFAETGVSYIPGLVLLLLSLYVLISQAPELSSTWLKASIAGAAFAGAVCLWFLYILAAPAVALAPLALVEDRRNNPIRLGLQTTLVAGLVTFATYGLVMAHLGLSRWQEVHAWISASSHGIDNIKGLSRTVFGFARSFVDMGRDGLLYKRFLLHDPYNPVSFSQLLTLTLGKFLLFYSLLIFVLVALLGSRQRTLLLALGVSAIPVIGFALMWQGGDMERYLPLYPLCFIAVGSALREPRSSPWLKWVVLVFAVFAIVDNSFALSKVRLDRQRRLEVARFEQLQSILKPESQVVLLDHELLYLGSDSFRSSQQGHALPLYILLVPGTSSVLTWRENFASMALSVWNQGADVWISNHVLNSRPDANLNWAEGDDRRISWNDIQTFFSRVEMGSSVGGSNGFELMPPSRKNCAFLRTMAINSTAANTEKFPLACLE